MNETTPTPPSLRIRLSRPEEYSAISSLTESAYEHDYALASGYRAQIVAVAERAGAHEVWVAEDAATGELLGTVSTPRDGTVMTGIARDDEIDFRFLGVAPAARRRGIGIALVQHVIALAERRGIRRVVLGTGPEMLGAHVLYERLGFIRDPARDQTFERPDGAGTFSVIAYGLDVAACGARLEV